MSTFCDVLNERYDELPGYEADGNDCFKLREKIQDLEFGPLLMKVFENLPICGMIVSFVIDNAHNAHKRSKNIIADDFDPEHDHEFYWMNPQQILWEITHAHSGPVVYSQGFLPIGIPTIGGDPYYLKCSNDRSDLIEVYEVYQDCVDPADDDPVPSNAYSLIAHDFRQLLQVARYAKGLEIDA